MVDIGTTEVMQGFDWVGFDKQVSLKFIPDSATPTTVSVTYVRRQDPKQTMILQDEEKGSIVSANDRAHEIVRKMPLSALKTLVASIEQGILDIMQTVFYLKNEGDTQRIAICVEDFLEVVHTHVSSIAEKVGLAHENYYENNKDADITSQRLQDLKHMLEKLTNYDDSSGYATLSLTHSITGTVGIDSRQHEPSYSTIMYPSAQEKLDIEISTKLQNKKTWWQSDHLKLNIVSLLVIILLVTAFLALGLYFVLGQRSSLPHASTTTTITPMTTPVNATQITDCYDWRYKLGHDKSGIYTVYPNGIEPFAVYCDMVTDGGGWTVFQKRQDNSLVFWNRTWSDYKNGFNNSLERNAWLGLDRIHLLSTKDTSVTMRIEVWDNRSKRYNCDPINVFLFGEWDFHIDNEENQYRLHLEPWKAGNLSYLGDDYLQQNNNQPFCTVDHDNSFNTSVYIPRGCLGHQDSPERPYHWGAWWYGFVGSPVNFCGNFFLNGEYDPPRDGWAGFACLHTSVDHPVNGTYHSGDGSVNYHPCFVQPRRSEMKLRRNDYVRLN